jgi:hypothetical protein
MTTELKSDFVPAANLRDGSVPGTVVDGVPGVSLPDAILALVRAMVAQSDPALRERLALIFEALHISNHMSGAQVATFLAQLVSDIAYAARDPEETTPRPIATFMDRRLLGAPAGSA